MPPKSRYNGDFGTIDSAHDHFQLHYLDERILPLAILIWDKIKDGNDAARILFMQIPKRVESQKVDLEVWVEEIKNIIFAFHGRKIYDEVVEIIDNFMDDGTD